jgi:hypothetical protein
VDELPGPGEAEPEPTPLPEDDEDVPVAPARFPASRAALAAVALLAVVALLLAANGMRKRLDRPLPEPAHAAAN